MTGPPAGPGSGPTNGPTNGPSGGSRAADDGIGSVAQETARLVDAFAAMVRTSGRYADGAGSSGTQRHSDPEAGKGAPAYRNEPPVGTGSAGTEEHSKPEATGRAPAYGAEAPAAEATRCPHCGAHEGQQPMACRLCPVCQGIALLRELHPEALARIADLALAVAVGLRDLATQARSNSSHPSSGRRDDATTRSRHATVQEIPVEDIAVADEGEVSG